MNPLLLKRGLLITLLLFAFSLLKGGAGFGLDLSSSDRSGMYPWEGRSVYEEIAIVKLPSETFNQALMGLISNTPLAQAFTAPFELRPILTASVVARVLETTENSNWQPIKGDPNPILLPIFTVLLQQFSGNSTKAFALGQELSAYPLMMPDSAGSAVLELKNSNFENPLLQRDISYAVMLPFKVGFWVERDYLHVDILNPEAITSLLARGEEGTIRNDLIGLAHEAREGLIEALWDALSAIFDDDDILFRSVPLPPYLTPEKEVLSPSLTQIGSVKSDLPLTDVVKGLLEAKVPNSSVDMRFFQTYAAFDGMSGMIENAIKNPRDRTGWTPTPDGEVADDVMFLNWITTNPSFDLPFIRSILTPIFKKTFLVPRGISAVFYNIGDGKEMALMDVGSPYFGQILLRMGGHRAPGTPCKIITLKEGDRIHFVTIDPSFMFKAFFGDTHPESIHQWEGAFDWPYGLDLETLGQEAKYLFVAYTAMAVSHTVHDTTGAEVELSEEAQKIIQEVFLSAP